MPIKVVVDTNVFISSFWGGKPKEIIDLWINGEITICISEPILAEYLRVMIEKLHLNKDKIDRLVNLFGEKRNIEEVTPAKKFDVIKEDIDDNMFIDCAVEANAFYIISGDHHLLDLKKFQGIDIISPAAFLSTIERENF
ncbi:MAG: putative toxin-antitoxin system toxin component, PIN family [Candidatus Lokiarchaeota archaeon]|nr:putative toxin-antitoxin system toxin component, PIN family [Candidatus Lokiarchaeota archaeon]